MFGPKYPETWTPLPLERRFSAVEYDLIVAGHVSESMDDHWNILFKDDTLYLYRSWTGVCMFRVRFVKTGNEYAVAEAAIGISPFADHIDHRAMLSDVIDFVLLRKPRPLDKFLAQIREDSLRGDARRRSRPWWKSWSNRENPET
jgi:hypothetical protein